MQMSFVFVSLFGKLLCMNFDNDVVRQSRKGCQFDSEDVETARKIVVVFCTINDIPTDLASL